MYFCSKVSLLAPNLIRDNQKNVFVIKNINLKIENGMRVGIVGQNGSGKTMLLKLLSGRILPTQGKIRYPRNVRAIFSSNFGMDQSVSGLHNIYMQCLAMGIDLERIESLVPGIIEFSMLGQDINKPLYAYSSGMKLRLSVSISLATIDKHLVIDEWFGAGDKYFGKKLEQGLERVIKNDGTLITSSHNMNLLRRICNTGIYINNGKLMFMGTIDDTIRMYNEET